MISELSFLIELLLNHKLPKPTRDAVAERIKDVEANLATNPTIHTRLSSVNGSPVVVGGSVQSASTAALLAKHPDLVAQMNAAPAAPVAVIAQTPAAVAAMNSRQTAINEALSGKAEKGRTSPRKF